jgi:serine protease Do
MNRTRIARTIAILLFASIGCRQGSPDAAEAAQTTTRAVSIPPTVSAERRTPIVAAVHDVMPAVVNIQTEATIRRREADPFFGFFFGPDRRSYRTESLGSGFVWASDGTIVTNAHVIEGASKIIVNFSDGRQLEAKVVGVDPDSDLAVLKVEAKSLPLAPIGTSSDLLIGETVIAVGNPFGLSGSVTTGVVSATGRSVPSKERDRTYTDFIQTDASINPGNSGGPLLNIEGKVIGINVAIYAQAQGIGFAIPVDRAKKVVEDLRRFGEVHVVYTGLVTTTVTPEEARRIGVAEPKGAMVIRVFAGSPAERAGLRVGDVITAFNGAAVDSREGLNTTLATAPAGRAARLTVNRSGSRQEISLTPAEPPTDLGLRILREVSGLEVTSSRGAVMVDAVERGSRGDEVGLAPGDIIVAVNGVEVATMEEINTQLTRSADRASIVLAVARGRYIYTLTFPMGEQVDAAAL